MKTPAGPLPKKAMMNTTESLARTKISLGMSGKSDRGLIFLILGMFAAGIFLMAMGGYEIKGSRESGSWPTAQGTISSSSVSKRTTRDSDHRTRTTYYPNVGYTYQAEGRKYLSTRIVFGVGESGGSMKWAQKIVNRYPVGKTVTVYYNPEDPQYGVLESGFTWRSLMILISGIVFFTIGVICVKAKLKQRRNAQTF